MDVLVAPGLAPPGADGGAARLFYPLGLDVSPDGSRLVYIANHGGSTQLYLRPIDRFEADVIREHAEKRRAQRAEAERDAVEHASHHADLPRHKLHRIDENRRERARHDHADDCGSRKSCLRSRGWCGGDAFCITAA